MRKTVLLICMTLMLALVGTTGCISKSIDQERRPVIQLMKKVPSGCDSFMLMDVKEMQSDPVYELLSGNTIDTIEKPLKWMGIDISKIDYIFTAVGYEDKGVSILQGSFDFLETKVQFDDLMSGSEYKGVDIWEDLPDLVALIPHHIIMGDATLVVDCIGIVKDGDASLYDDMAYKGIINKLSDGPYVLCGNASFWKSMEVETYSEVMGIVWQFKKADIIELTTIARFEHENEATIKMTEFSDDMINDANFETLITNFTTEGQYGYATFEIDTEHPLEPLNVRKAEASETELKNVILALVALMADSGASELDADYTEVDTYEEVKNVTTNDGVYRLTTYLDIKAGESLFQEYDIAKNGVVNISSERLTEFYILGTDRTASIIPSKLTVNEETNVIVGIVNHEKTTVHYKVEVTIDGYPTKFIGFYLDHEEKYEEQVNLIPKHAGPNQKVEFTLFRDNEDSPYQTLHLWVDVNE